MKKKTYDVLSKIPVVNVIAYLSCKPILFCSQMLDDGEIPKLLEEYAKKHPDELITEKVLKEIMK